MIINKILGFLGISLITFIVVILGLLPTLENYNKFNPWVDTIVSSGFSEEKFKTIKIGMDTVEVQSIIGIPLYTRNDTSNNDSNYQIWVYTSDGKFKHGDFAWLSRSLFINKDGRVEEISSFIAYD